MLPFWLPGPFPQVSLPEKFVRFPTAENIRSAELQLQLGTAAGWRVRAPSLLGYSQLFLEMNLK